MYFPLKRHPSQYARTLPEDTLAWPAFVPDTAKLLAAEGWRIVVEEGFRHSLVSAEGEWQADIEDKGGWWFSLIVASKLRAAGIDSGDRQVPAGFAAALRDSPRGPTVISILRQHGP